MPDFGRWTSNGGDPSLNEINRSDRFIDALASQQPVYATDPSEAELASLLAGWRDEIRTPPLMAPVTPRDAAIALRKSVESRKRTRFSLTLVGTTAAAVLCLGGFGAIVAGAGPGDALYGLHTMLFGEQQTTRTDAVSLASQQLAEVKQLIDTGQWDAAQEKLQTLTTTVATVNDVEQKQELVDQWQQLTVKVDAKDPDATLPPGIPPPEMPVPAVVDSGTTTTSTSTSSATETSTPASSDTSATSSPVVEPPPVTTTAPVVTTTTAPPVTTTTPPATTTTTRATTATSTTTTVPPGPVAGGGTPEVVAPTSVPEPPKPQAPAVEVPKPRAPESPVIEAPATETIPVTTTTTIVIAPPKAGGRGE